MFSLIWDAINNKHELYGTPTMPRVTLINLALVRRKSNEVNNVDLYKYVSPNCCLR